MDEILKGKWRVTHFLKSVKYMNHNDQSSFRNFMHHIEGFTVKGLILEKSSNFFAHLTWMWCYVILIFKLLHVSLTFNWYFPPAYRYRESQSIDHFTVVCLFWYALRSQRHLVLGMGNCLYVFYKSLAEYFYNILSN